MALLKMRSWSPDSDREEAWLLRQAVHCGHNGRPRSVTDEDLDELRGSIDLGFNFDAESPAASVQILSETLPALDIYFSVHRCIRASATGSPDSAISSSSDDERSTSSPDVGNPALFSLGEGAEQRKARLKQCPSGCLLRTSTSSLSAQVITQSVLVHVRIMFPP